MAIKTISETINGIVFVHTYSDDGRKIIQSETGRVYDDAYDPLGSGKTYTESGAYIDTKNETAAEEIARLKAKAEEQAKQIETTAQAVQDLIIQTMDGRK